MQLNLIYYASCLQSFYSSRIFYNILNIALCSPPSKSAFIFNSWWNINLNINCLLPSKSVKYFISGHNDSSLRHVRSLYRVFVNIKCVFVTTIINISKARRPPSSLFSSFFPFVCYQFSVLNRTIRSVKY